jgi:hypothetical protein
MTSIPNLRILIGPAVAVAGIALVYLLLGGLPADVAVGGETPPTQIPTTTPTPIPIPIDGTVEICKDTDPDNSGKTFHFSTNILGITDFVLEDDQGLDCELEESVEPGDFEITESPAPGWVLDDIDCSGASGVTEDLENNTVTIELEAGDDVLCTFTNVQQAATVTPTSTTTPTPSDTGVPPTSTTTPSPTASPTHTGVPPAATTTPSPTHTAVPPTATSTNTPVVPATPGNTIGDVNKNGVINPIDSQLILQAEAGFITLANVKNADTNEDGEVNSVDSNLILQFVAGRIGNLPPS